MPYGIIKVDQVTFTNAGADQTISVSGIVASISGNITATGTISGNVIRGGTTVSGATVTGSAGQFGTITGNTAGFTTVTGTTVTGTTATFTSGVFTNISGGTHTITSGVFASGTAANPSITFQGDVNTGIYSPGADQVAISTNGTGRLFVNASGHLLVNETSNPLGYYLVVNTGTGTNNNAAILSNNANADLRFNLTGGVSLVDANTGTLALGTSGSERLRITSAGLVGVGTSAPTENLTVYGTSSRLAVTGGAGSSAILLGNQNGSGANNPSVIEAANGSLFFGGGNSWSGGGTFDYTMTLTNDNKVGVGTTSPSETLHVVGSIRTGAVGDFVYANNFGQISSAQPLALVSNSETVFKNTSGTERARIDSSGRLGIGTSSPGYLLDVAGSARIKTGATGTPFIVSTGSDSQGSIRFGSTGGSGIYGIYGGADYTGLQLWTNGSQALTIDNSQRVGIGSTAPNRKLEVSDASADNFIRVNTTGATKSGIEFANGGAVYSQLYFNNVSPYDLSLLQQYTTGSLILGTNSTERARIDSSGRLLVGTSNYTGNSKFVVAGLIGGDVGLLDLRYTGSRPTVADITVSEIRFGSSDLTANTAYARIIAESDGASSSGSDIPGRLVFSTTADGASSPTERMTIKNNGDVLVTKTAVDYAVVGAELKANGAGVFTTDGIEVLSLNRKTSDGDLVRFFQDQAQEGTISVSGTTVSYNGAHLSRWSQLPSGAERIDILRGTVLSNIDEMCEWGDEDNEQLNRMKVSDVEGDRNVAGVFQGWDDDDDTYTNDFYCAMTGDFIIRIAAGVAVERGDLLMSAGDGTAKPQDDDIIRSKTIAKVTSTNVTCTYDDGSYCVPCVLMAC